MQKTATQIIQSYNIDSLIDTSPLIADIKEYLFRQGPEERPRYKLINRYPAADEWDTGSGAISTEQLTRLFGDKAEAMRKMLVRKKYLLTGQNNHSILSWRFRSISGDAFDIGLGAELNSKVFRALEALLLEPLPDDAGVNEFLEAYSDDSANIIPAASCISANEYWYRQGVDIVAVRFTQNPTPELISLIDHKLQMIQQEKMQNYFHIISSYNSDASFWRNETDRYHRFFEIVERLLTYTWRPFDMETCELSIDAAGDSGLFASGSLRVDFTDTGAAAASLDRMEKHYPPVDLGGKRFIVNDVVLRSAASLKDSSFLSLRMVSRSPGNVDPRRNMLTHRFVKLLIESVGKIIDVIMPVIRREEAEAHLRWRSFLDSQRLLALGFGENLHRILNESFRALQHFFNAEDILVFSEDKELIHMLKIFSQAATNMKFYAVLENPLTPTDILREQMVVFPIREVPGGRVLLYFTLPRSGKKPMKPESPDQYLMGTELWTSFHEEALILGLSNLGDFLFFMVTECLTTNPKAVMANVARRLPVRGDVSNEDLIMRLTRRILERFSRFFDLFQTISGNLESGLAYMRGRRDNLTGLYNRQYFKALLNESFSRPDHQLGLMFLDMDNFKIYNDTVSHDFGDKLLVSLANRMVDSANLIGSDAVSGRFGGDEFCFFIDGMKQNRFEHFAVKIFKSIIKRPITVHFFLDDRPDGEGMEINLIAFLHRLMRPDVGSRQASRTEYVEKPQRGPRGHVVDVWKHGRLAENNPVNEQKVPAQHIIDQVSRSIEDKIVYNKIFPVIDAEFSRIIQLFITLQMKNYSTDQIRTQLIREAGDQSYEREITIKVSAGLAHSRENRLRSLESLFKAADSRAYLAKHNGRNCMFGIDGQQLT